MNPSSLFRSPAIAMIYLKGTGIIESTTSANAPQDLEDSLPLICKMIATYFSSPLKVPVSPRLLMCSRRH